MYFCIICHGTCEQIEFCVKWNEICKIKYIIKNLLDYKRVHIFIWNICRMFFI